MEIDEHGRPVRRPRPPGRPDPRTLPEAFPAFEHNQWSFEGEIERLGAFARGVHRARGVSRPAGVLIALAVGLPFLVLVPVALWRLVFG